MKLVIQGKNIDITDSIYDYVHQKIEKAVSHYENRNFSRLLRIYPGITSH